LRTSRTIEVGHTYGFYSLVRDLVGNVTAADVSPNAASFQPDHQWRARSVFGTFRGHYSKPGQSKNPRTIASRSPLALPCW
jgi:hypothetical protein